MPVPQKDYILPILQSLADGSTKKTSEMQDEVYQQLEFDAEDLEDMGYGHDRRYKNFNWSKTHLKGKKCIENVRHGYWRITANGIRLLKELTDNI